MARRLKIFRYSDGFHAWTVAAPSRARALEAWGVTRDLFKDGSATQVDDDPDAAAALATPGQLIERGLEIDVGDVRATKPKSRTRPAATRRDRAKVDALRAQLTDLDGQFEEAMNDLEKRRVALNAEADGLRRAHDKKRDTLKTRLTTARAKSDR